MLLLLAALCARVPDQPESGRTPDSAGMVMVSRWDRGGANTVQTRGGFTFVGTGASVLVFRNSMPVSAVALPGACEDLALAGDLLYAAAGKAGMVALDARDPAQPRVVGELDLPGYALGVAGDWHPVSVAESGACTRSSLAAVSSGPDGVFLIDASVPGRPQLTFRAVPVESVLAVALHGDRALFACGRAGLVVARSAYVLDEITVLGCPGSARNLALKDSIVYVVCGDSGVLVVNVARPERPERMLRLDLPLARAMAISDSLAAVVCGARGAWLLNVRDPARPFVWCYLPVEGFAVDVALEGGRMVVAAGAAGLAEYDVSRPTAPVLVRRTPMPGRTLGAAVEGSTGWVCTSDGLHAVDISLARSPDLGFLPLPGPPQAIAMGRGFAVLGLEDSGLVCVVTREPRAPVVLSRPKVPGPVSHLAVRDSWVFAGVEGYGLAVLNAARPESVAEAGALRGIPAATGMCARRSFLVLATGDSGLYFCDVRDPTSPLVVKRLMLPGRVNAVWFDTITMVAGDSGLFILDTRDVIHPRVMTRVPLVAEAWDMVVVDSLCYLACDWVGVVCFDVSDPAAPIAAGYYGGPTVARHLDMVGTDVVMTDEYTGLVRVRLKREAVPASSLRDRPPWVSAQSVQFPPVVWAAVWTGNLTARAELFDLSGRRLAAVSIGPADRWQLAEFPAFPLGAGVFFVRVETQGRVAVRRIHLVR